jgi:hypothetical protein
MIKLFEQYIKGDIEISLINNDIDKQFAIDIINNTFKKYGGFSTISGAVDFTKSIVIKKDDEIIGTYLLGTNPVHIIENMKHYLGLKGIEGVALAIKPEYRNLGYGNMMKDYSIETNKNYDYIWGMQLKDLQNVKDWSKRRRIVFQSSDLIITLQDIKDTFPYLKQTSGINCGPTSLKMLLDYYKKMDNISIDELTQIMEVDMDSGTTDIRMKKGLDFCDLNYLQIITNDKDALNLLKNYVKNDRKILLRTLTHGIKHWVVVYDYKDGLFSVADPWFGKIIYNEKQIYSIWKPRNFDGFIVYGDKKKWYDELNKIIKLY